MIDEVLNFLRFSVAVVVMVIFAGISIVIVDPLLAAVALTVFPLRCSSTASTPVESRVLQRRSSMPLVR